MGPKGSIRFNHCPCSQNKILVFPCIKLWIIGPLNSARYC